MTTVSKVFPYSRLLSMLILFELYFYSSFAYSGSGHYFVQLILNDIF